MFSDTKPAGDARSASGREFEFTLKLRVECPKTLWRAAMQHHAGDDPASREEMAELIGPAEDPSVEDCLMALALPGRLPGCTMLDVLLTGAGSDVPAPVER